MENHLRRKNMRKNAYVALFFTVAFAVVALFAATEVMAQDPLDSCQDGGEKITINLLEITKNGVNTEYVYEIIGAKSVIRKINRLVGVATRPVLPEQFVPPAGDFGKPDTATKICTGDLDSFCFSITPQPDVSTRKTFSVIVTPDTLQGLWTLNAIFGTSGVLPCIGDDDKGITGPGCLDCGPVPEFATYSVATDQEIETKSGYKFKVQCDPKTGDCIALQCYKPGPGGGWGACTQVPLQTFLSTRQGAAQATRLSKMGAKGGGFVLDDSSPSSPSYCSGGWCWY